MRPDRPVIRQNFFPFGLTVGVTPTPISTIAQQDALGFLYVALTISNAAAAANSVWFGDASISVAGRNGLEITAGTSKTIAVSTRPQLYELQEPLIAVMQCPVPPYAIPFVALDPTTMFLVAAAPTLVGIILFPEMFK